MVGLCEEAASPTEHRRTSFRAVDPPARNDRFLPIQGRADFAERLDDISAAGTSPLVPVSDHICLHAGYLFGRRRVDGHTAFLHLLENFAFLFVSLLGRRSLSSEKMRVTFSAFSAPTLSRNPSFAIMCVFE